VPLQRSIGFVVLAIRPSGDEGVFHPSQPSDELGKCKRKGDNNGCNEKDDGRGGDADGDI